MRGRRPGGASVLEVLLGLLVLFLTSLYLMGLFASGQGFELRSREYALAGFLAQNRMEELLAAPAESLGPSSGLFPAPHEGYAWQVRVGDFEEDLQWVRVSVTSPRGARSTLETLRRVESFYGVACDPAARTLVYATRGEGAVRLLEDGGSPVPGPGLPAGAGAPRAGGLAGGPELGLLWVVDQGNPALRYFRFDGSGGFDGGETLEMPASPGPSFAGAATDGVGNRLFLADRASRSLWILRDAEAFGGRAWEPRCPVAPEDPPLGVPAGVALDGAGSLAWVADAENGCLRLLLLDPATTPAPREDYEEEPGLGWWSRRRFRPPEGLGAPQGVATNPWSSVVYAVDETHLVLLEFVPRVGGGYIEAWSRVPLPEDLVAARPSGISLDPFRNVVYLNTRSGEVWKHVVAPPASFTRLVGAQVP